MSIYRHINRPEMLGGVMVLVVGSSGVELELLVLAITDESFGRFVFLWIDKGVVVVGSPAGRFPVLVRFDDGPSGRC
jgi:hypothetical protein